MRTRINRRAICSSDNYEASRHSHLAWLEEAHKNFSMVSFSKPDDNAKDELSAGRKMARQRAKDNEFVYVKMFGGVLKLTRAEYEAHGQGMTVVEKPNNIK